MIFATTMWKRSAPRYQWALVLWRPINQAHGSPSHSATSLHVSFVDTFRGHGSFVEPFFVFLDSKASRTTCLTYLLQVSAGVCVGGGGKRL